MVPAHALALSTPTCGDKTYIRSTDMQRRKAWHSIAALEAAHTQAYKRLKLTSVHLGMRNSDQCAKLECNYMPKCSFLPNSPYGGRCYVPR